MTQVCRKLNTGYRCANRISYNTSEGFAGLVMNIGAVRHGNQIYAVFQDNTDTAASYSVNSSSERDSYASYYNGTSWSADYKVGDCNPTHSDGHGSPSIARAIKTGQTNSSGSLHVFFGCHDDQCSYAVSTNPDNVTAWTDRTTRITGASKAGSCSYPICFVAPDTGRMVLMFRDTVSPSNYNLAHMVSDNNGDTWSDKTIFVNDTNSTEDATGNCWPYHVSGPNQYVSSLSGLGWCIEYNWNERVRSASSFTRKHQYYAILRFSDLEFYDVSKTKRSTNGTFSQGTANSYFRTITSITGTNTGCVGSVYSNTKCGIPIRTTWQPVNGTASARYVSHEYISGAWVNEAVIEEQIPVRNPDTSNIFAFDYEGRTYAVGDPFAYNAASNSSNNAIELYEYNWFNHKWKKLRNIMKIDETVHSVEAAFVRYPTWAGTVPNEGPVICWQDVGYATGTPATWSPGNRAYVAAINNLGVLETVHDGFNSGTTSSGLGLNINRQGADFVIEERDGLSYALNCNTGKIDFTGTYPFVLSSSITSSPSAVIISKADGVLRTERYIGGKLAGGSCNMESPDFDITATGTFIYKLRHNLGFQPKKGDISVNIIETSNCDDWYAFPRVVDADNEYVIVKATVMDAAALSGAKARLGVKISSGIPGS